MYERPRVNVKVEPRSTFTTPDLPYIVSNLFTHVKAVKVYVRTHVKITRQWKSTLNRQGCEINKTPRTWLKCNYAWEHQNKLFNNGVINGWIREIVFLRHDRFPRQTCLCILMPIWYLCKGFFPPLQRRGKTPFLDNQIISWPSAKILLCGYVFCWLRDSYSQFSEIVGTTSSLLQ